MPKTISPAPSGLKTTSATPISDRHPEYYSSTSINSSEILHILNSILLFHLLKIYGFKKSNRLLASLIFFLYPGYDYAIYWVSNFSEMLGVLFILLSLIINNKYPKGLMKYLLLWCIFILASFTKESALIIPFLLLSEDSFLVHNKGTYKRDWIKYTGIFLIFLFALFIHLRIALESPPEVSLNKNILSVGENLINYILLSPFPFFLHSKLNPWLIHILRLLSFAIILVPLSRLLIKEKKPQIVYLLLPYLLLLFPYSVTNYFSTRYLYPASIFFAPLVVIALNYYSKTFSGKSGEYAKYFLSGIILTLFVLQTINNQLVYKKMAANEIESPAGVAFKRIEIELRTKEGSQKLLYFSQGERLSISKYVALNGVENRFFNVLHDFPQKKPGFYIHRKGSYDVCWLEKEGEIIVTLPQKKENTIQEIGINLTIINILEGEENHRNLKITAKDQLVGKFRVSRTITKVSSSLKTLSGSETVLSFLICPI